MAAESVLEIIDYSNILPLTAPYPGFILNSLIPCSKIDKNLAMSNIKLVKTLKTRAYNGF